MNVLDWNGPAFLQFYLCSLGVVVLLGIITRWLLRAPSGLLPRFAENLDPFEIAYLCGGPKRAVDAALASLIHTEQIKISATAGQLTPEPRKAVAARDRTFADSVYEAIATGLATVMRVRHRADSLTASMADRLRAADLTPSSAQSARIRFLPAIWLLALLIIGLGKIFIGVSRNRPVGFLVVLCVVTAVIAIIFAAVPCYRTRAADRLLRTLRSRNSALRTSVSTAPDRVAHADLAFAVALFGPTVLTTGTLGRLRQVLVPPSSGGSGGSCSSGSSCGGGGCGGGGCGGCGGG